MTRIEPPDWRAMVRARLDAESLRPEIVEECVEELAQHLEAAYQDLRARGVSPDQSRDDLVGQLESAELMEMVSARSRLQSQPTPGLPARRRLPALAGDLRYAARSLRRVPMLTTVIVLSLGIVIGANTAIFGLVESLILRRLPIPRADELVAVHASLHGRPHSFDYRQLQTVRAMPGMQELQGFRIEPATVRTGADSVDLWIDMVTGGFLNLLGARPLLGRTLVHADETSAAPVVVVSFDFWRSYLGANPNVVGRALQVGTITTTIVGVMPSGFTGIHFARRFNLMMPISLSPGGIVDPGDAWVTMLARSGGALNSLAALDAVIGRCCIDPTKFGFVPPTRSERRWARPSEQAPRSSWGLASADSAANIAVLDASRGIPWHTDYRGRYASVLFALVAGGAVLLLIACVNVATLLVARAVARRRDFAIRLAIGASRGRIAMQLLTETLLLSFGGAMVGVLVAQAGNRLLLRNLPPAAARLSDSIAWQPNAVVFLFTAGIVALCTVFVGVWPARSATRADVTTPLNGGHPHTHASRWPVGATLVSVQVACAVVLVVLGALFAATLRQLTATQGGYGTSDVLLARIGARGAEDSAGGLRSRYQEILREVAALPGVRGAAFSTSAPVLQDAVMQMAFTPSGRKPNKDDPWTRWNAVTSGYFTASGIGLQEGRDFRLTDNAHGEPVVILSAAMARRHFPSGALGATIGLFTGTARVVGIARDARYDKLAREPSLRIVDDEILYLPIEQAPHAPVQWFAMTLIARMNDDAIASIPTVRARLAEVAPELQVNVLTSVGQLLDDLTVGERFLAALMNVFAALALLLASAGVFGVMSYQVTQRTREIGVRMALGARPADAVWLVLRRALLVTGIGTLIGTILALGAGRAVRAQLYGISAADPWVFVFAASLLFLVASLAALRPSALAARVDPLQALRAE